MMPAHIRAYLAAIENACKTQASGSAVRPVVMAAILDHESQGGRALKPPGPSGTGDFKPRTSQRYANSQYFKLMELDGGTHGFMPFDLKGWGRGLFQIDFGGHTEWCMRQLGGGAYLWELPEYNAAKAVEIFAEALTNLDGDEEAAIAAYNAGWPRVREELEMLTPVEDPALKYQSRLLSLDRLTTGGAYVSSILNRIDRWTAPPDVPPPPKPGSIT